LYYRLKNVFVNYNRLSFLQRRQSENATRCKKNASI
jgi:hypothetical protein